LAETLDQVRIGDACAFSLTDREGCERAVLVIQCRITDEQKQKALKDRLRQLVFQELGIECYIELVPRNTLVRTTSGKPSRDATRKRCLERGLRLPDQ
jgi:fatty-acyl-CoA synthase